MPQLPVTCPRCGADLTVGRELLNRPVECGGCGRAFVPVADPGGREPDELPTRKPQGHGGPLLGILSLITAVLGLGTCCFGPMSLILSSVAVVIGLLGLRSRDSRALSIVGIVVGALALGLRLFGYLSGWRGAFDL